MTAQLLAARDAVVREHMESENRHDHDAAIATFVRPRYELAEGAQGATEAISLADDVHAEFYARRAPG